MAKVELTPEQKRARTAYKRMQGALMILVAELGDGGTEKGSPAQLLTQAMDSLEKKYGKETTRA